jgi:hypothetical protein
VVEGDKAASVTDMLYLLITSVNSQGESIASTKTSIKRYEKLTLQEIQLQYSSRTITLCIYDYGKDGKQLTIGGEH